MLGKLKSEGKVGANLAMVSVADQFGIELSTAGREALKKAGFNLVYDKTYPIGSQDMAPLLAEAKNLNPDAFVAFAIRPIRSASPNRRASPGSIRRCSMSASAPRSRSTSSASPPTRMA